MLVRRITLAIAAATSLLLSGCSHESGYPAIYNTPPPRSDTPMTTDEQQKATDDLITKRDRLNTPSAKP